MQAHQVGGERLVVDVVDAPQNLHCAHSFRLLQDHRTVISLVNLEIIKREKTTCLQQYCNWNESDQKFSARSLILKRDRPLFLNI